MVQVALFFAAWRCLVASKSSSKEGVSFRESIPGPKVQLIFLMVSLAIILLDGPGWGVGAFLYANFIAIGYKMYPRFFTEA